MTQKVFFAIPLAAKRCDSEWRRIEELLENTLTSIARQTDERYQIVLCGHNRPDILDRFTPSNLVYLSAPFPKPETDEKRRADKRRKRAVIAAFVRRQGGGYFSYQDADDIVHKNYVATILRDDNKNGYLIDHGFTLDYNNRVLAPIPGAWSKPFNHICGSSACVYYHPDDLPSDANSSDSNLRFFRVNNHLSFDDTQIFSTPLTRMNWPAMIYVINNGVNLSNILVRTEERQQSLILSVKTWQVSHARELLQDFSVEHLFG